MASAPAPLALNPFAQSLRFKLEALEADDSLCRAAVVVLFQQLLRRDDNEASILMIKAVARVRVFKYPDLHGGHRQRNISAGHKLAAIRREGHAALKRINSPATRLFMCAPTLSE